ncbi:hypothetical protein [Limimaricola cinnabarinus]|uniref:hypothetical protein n=1 Tax=Limimaricola cinnabarinus TaxID=1125964 RepID=UPI00248FB213|nr:hypothetical protein [Limimaricola cinnabarinus]
MQAHIAVRSTPTPESAHDTFGGEVRVGLTLHETADGSLSLKLEMQEGEGQGLGLSALVFDFADQDLLGQLSLTGPHLHRQSFGRRKVRGPGASGRGYDCGARFERQGRLGRLAPRETDLLLAHDRLALTLDDLAGRAFSLHLAPMAANHAACEGFTIEGRFPARPAAGRPVRASDDGSVFGGVFDEILPLMSRLIPAKANAA